MMSSTGSGPTNWKNVSVDVESRFATTSSMTLIRTFLDQQYVIAPPKSIPRAYFDAGVSYTFTIRACNFLNLCGLATAKVSVLNVTSPYVMVQGGRSRSIKRSDDIRLFANVHVLRACDANETKSGINYAWSVTANNIELTSIFSQSRNPSMFYLPALSFPIAQIYKVVLRGIDTITGFSATDTIIVSVVEDPLTVQVVGPSVQSVAAGGSLSLSALTSMEAFASSFAYNWSCYQTYPTLSSSCGISFPGTASKKTVSLHGNRANSTSVVQITVASNSETAIATVTVHVMARNVPNITLSISMENVGTIAGQNGAVVIRAGSKLKLSANASFLSEGLDFNALPLAQWSFVGGTTNLSAHVSTPTTVDLAQQALRSSALNGTYRIPVNLVILENAMTAGNTYTLQLKADRYQYSFTVYANLAPVSGTFSINPTSGGELSVQFLLLASLWIDSDLPLTYSFGYRGLDDVVLPLRLPSEAAFTTSQLVCLSRRSATDTAIVVLQVFDAFGADTSSSLTATISCNTARSNAQFAQLLKGTLESADGDDSGISKAIALGSGVVNSVDCTKAINCGSKYHRSDCTYTANTCGKCLPGYVGANHDANSPCVAPASQSSHRRLEVDLLASSCTSGSNCADWQMCRFGMCEAQLVACPGQGACSNHGSCYYANKNTGHELMNCSVVDVFCETICQCEAGFYGTGCEYNASDWFAAMDSRRLLVDAMLDVANLVDLRSNNALQTQIAQLNAVTRTADQMNLTVLSDLADLAADILTNAQSVQLSRSKTIVLMDTIESMLLIQNNATHYGAVIDIIDQYRATLLQDMVLGEYNVESIGSEMRFVLSLLSSTSLLQQSTHGAIPVSSFEQEQSLRQHVISIPAIIPVNHSSVSVFGLEIKSKLVPTKNQTKLISNPVLWWFAGYNNAKFTFPENATDVNLTTTLQYNQLINIIPPHEIIRKTVCYDRDYYVENYTCLTSSDIIRDHCPGEPGIITDRCTIFNVSSVCSFLETISNYNVSNCITLDYTEQNVTCQCNVAVGMINSTAYDFAPASSRRLSASSFARQINFFALDYGASQFASTSNFDEFFVKSDDLSVEVTSYIIYISSSALAVGVLMWTIIFYYRDRFEAKVFKDKLKPAEEKKHRKRNLFAKTPTIEREADAIYDLAEDKLDEGDFQPTGPSMKRRANYEDIEIITEESLYGSLPRFFTPGNFFVKLWQEMCCYNRYMSLFVHRSGNYNRMFRVMELGVRVLCVMTFLVFAYSYTNPDDGSCDDFENQRICIAEDSALVKGKSKCYWTYSTHRCHFRLPGLHPVTAIIAAVAAGMIAAAITKFYEYYVLVKLCIPTSVIVPSNTSNGPGLFAQCWGYCCSGFTSSVEPMNGTNTEDVYDETPQALHRINLSTYDAYYTNGIVDITRYKSSSFIKAIPLEVEMENVQNRIKAYCDALPFLGQTPELVKMIGAWGMDSDYNFLRFSGNIPAPSFFEIDDRSDIIVNRMVDRIRENAVDELQILAFSPYTNDFERTNRLIYLFQRDFLASEIASKILDLKLFRDIFYQEWDHYDSYMFRYGGKNLSPNLQLLIIIFFHLLFVVMALYILYSTMGMYRTLQEDWIASLFIFLGSDIVIVAPLEVLFLHVFLPSLIYPDIQRINKMIIAYIDKCKALIDSGHQVSVLLNSNARDKQLIQTKSGMMLNSISIPSPSKPVNNGIGSDNCPSINSTQYMFVSNRVAQYFPDSTECKIILSYTNTYPPGYDLPPSWLRPSNRILIKNHATYTSNVSKIAAEAGEKVSRKVASRKYANSGKTHNIPDYLRNNNNRYESIFTFKFPLHCLIAILKSYLKLPFYLQELVIQWIFVLVAGGLVFIHYELYLIDPYLLAAPTVVLILLVCLYYLSVAFYQLGVTAYRRFVGVKIAPQPVEGIDADVENAEEYTAGMRTFHRGQLSSKNISRSIFEVADPQYNDEVDMYSDSEDEISIQHPAGQEAGMANTLWRVEDFDAEHNNAGHDDAPTARYEYNDVSSPTITKPAPPPMVSRFSSNNLNRNVTSDFNDFDDDDDFDDDEDDIDDIEDEYSTRSGGRNSKQYSTRVKPAGQRLRSKLKLNMKKVRNLNKMRK